MRPPIHRLESISRLRLRLLPALWLVGAAATAAAATPEETLLAGGLEPEYREPQQRCEFLAAGFDTIEQRLSLYREELVALRVSADGTVIADSATGALQFLAFESRLLGPASATITLDQRSATSLERLHPGRRIEISFIDRGGRSHSLFCGTVALVRADAAARRMELVALLPRAGTELQASALYQNQTCVDVLQGLAQSAGLAIEVTDQRPRTRYPQIAREKLSTWPFMQQLARLCQLELSLGSDGKLLVRDGRFVPPPAPSLRVWTDMTWVDIARSLAQEVGRAPDFRLTGVYPRGTYRQTVSNEDFLLQLAIAARASAWFTPGTLQIAEDGVWSSVPPGGGAVQANTDRLLKRVVVTGSGSRERSLSRRLSNPLAQAQDPERVPIVETVLLLGRAMPAGTMPNFALASSKAIAAALETTLTRLASQPATAYRRFLQDLVRHYRPTLQHLYRLRPDGLKELEEMTR